MRAVPRDEYGRMDCACGFMELAFGSPHAAATFHWHQHRMWEHGRPIPRKLLADGTLADGISKITVIDDELRVQFAYRLARTFRRLFRYDFVGFPALPLDPRHENWRVYRASMLVLARGGVAVGHAVLGRHPAAYPFDKANMTRIGGPVPGERWAIAQIFVCASARRSGVGRQLVRAAVSHAGVDQASELAWLSPFSDEGQALMEAVNPLDIVWLV